MAETTCSKCGSDNISYQREQTASFGGSFHKFGGGKSGHGCLWWLFVGWWIWIFWVFKFMFDVILACCTLGLSLLFRRKRNSGINGGAIIANKSINRTMAVCQNCGHSWKV